MPSDTSKKLIWDAREAAARILRFINDRDFQSYCEDEMFSSAVERQFIIIGEALSALKRKDAATALLFDELALIIAFRNILVHGYAEINNGVVWRAAKEDLPGLVEMLEEMLANSGSP